MMLLKALLLLAFLHVAIGQCDVYQEVESYTYYDIKSPGFPRNYSANTYCRWRAVARTGYVLVLSCDIFNIPPTPDCTTDRFSVSPSGDSSLSDAHKYCGKGTFKITSNAEYMTMVLQSTNTAGGYFRCNITSVPSKPQCDCGWKKQTRIVGGQETGVNEYPMMAAMVDTTLRRVYCGCTIISTNYVLTAAHCLLRKVPDNVVVLVGEHDLTTGADTTATKLYSVLQFIPHPDYNSRNQVNDIALVLVDGPITMSAEVMPACLPFRFQRESFTDKTVTVLGWGSTEYGGANSNVLMKANLNVISVESCKQSYGNSVSNNQMCTYTVGKDSCQSDSGGPVLWQDPTSGRVYETGIISYGIACATNSPSVNTRVTSYLDWIINNTPGETYCNV